MQENEPPQAQARRALTEENVFRGCNYVGTKETVAYLFNDWSNAFNINGFKDRFVWDVVKIDFGISAIVNLFTGALGIVPKLFWPINRKKRAQMYYELSERRNSMISDYMEGNGSDEP